VPRDGLRSAGDIAIAGFRPRPRFLLRIESSGGGRLKQARLLALLDVAKSGRIWRSA